MRYGTGVVMVGLAGVLWSFHGLIIRQIEAAEPWAVLAWRSVAMLPLMLLFLKWRSGSVGAALRAAGAAGVLGGMALVVAMGGAILAFQSTTVANAAFLLAAAPFLAALFGWGLLGERVARHTIWGIGLAVFGVFIMVRDGLAAGAWLGNIAALSSALGFAAFSVALRWRKLDDSLPAAILGAIFAIFAGSAAALHAGQPLLLPAMDLFWCAVMGIGTMALGMILYTLGSRVVPSAELTLLSNTEVLLAPVWAWLVLGESARSATFIGGAVVMVAILLNAFAGLGGRALDKSAQTAAQ